MDAKILSIDLQVFSPAQVIFVGIGVLLAVRILLDPCREATLTPKSTTGSQGC